MNTVKASARWGGQPLHMNNPVDRTRRPTPLRVVAGFSLLLGGIAAQAAPLPLLQINVSGAEFSEGVYPGVVGTNYFFPNEGFFPGWRGRGISIVRFPMKWERLQPKLGGGLDPTYAALIDKMLVQAAQSGVKVILDVHNYGRYHDQVISQNGAVTVAHYRNLMSHIALRWRGYSALQGYDLMNEPHDEADALWPTVAQTGINTIRLYDKTRPIYVEGRSWSSAQRWPAYNNDLLALKDPSNNLIFSAHQYLDPDGSGNYTNPIGSGWDPNIGVNRVKPFIDWLKANGKKGQIGEFGVPDNDARWLDAATRLLEYLRSECVPLTYWSSGTYWGNYTLAIEPVNGVTRPQWTVLAKYLATPSCEVNGPK